jgi:hypothetical protein
MGFLKLLFEQANIKLFSSFGDLVYCSSELSFFMKKNHFYQLSFMNIKETGTKLTRLSYIQDFIFFVFFIRNSKISRFEIY